MGFGDHDAGERGRGGNTTLHRLVGAGLLDRVTWGVYSSTTAVEDPLWPHKVAWLLLEPTTPAWKREPLDRNGSVVSHVSAATVLGLGDLVERGVELSVPRRRTTRNPDVRLRVRELVAYEVTEVGGLPVTSVGRTVADLLGDGVDGGHVADVAAQALRRGMVGRAGLARALAGHVRRLGARGRGRDAERCGGPAPGTGDGGAAARRITRSSETTHSRSK